MEVNQAIQVAKHYVADIFSDEGVFNIGLEEIEFRSGKWEVTVGFSRKWDRPPKNPFSVGLEQAQDHAALRRTYKIVEVDDESGRVTAVSNRSGVM